MKISTFLTELRAAEQAGDVPAMERLCRELFGFAFQGKAWAFIFIDELLAKGSITMNTMTLAAIEQAQDQISDRLDKILKILRKIEKRLEINNEKST